MKYINTKTGFVLNTECECKGQEWEVLDPSVPEEEKEVKPVKKRTRKDG